jgi:hypothetical protein
MSAKMEVNGRVVGVGLSGWAVSGLEGRGRGERGFRMVGLLSSTTVLDPGPGVNSIEGSIDSSFTGRLGPLGASGDSGAGAENISQLIPSGGDMRVKRRLDISSGT